jgi:hypothetical protein
MKVGLYLTGLRALESGAELEIKHAAAGLFSKGIVKEGKEEQGK